MYYVVPLLDPRRRGTEVAVSTGTRTFGKSAFGQILLTWFAGAKLCKATSRRLRCITPPSIQAIKGAFFGISGIGMKRKTVSSCKV